jgi:hypothetical protein
MAEIVLDYTAESTHEKPWRCIHARVPFPPTTPNDLNKQLEHGDAEMHVVLESSHAAIS